MARFQLNIYQKRRDNVLSNMNRRLMTRKSKLEADMLDPCGENAGNKVLAFVEHSWRALLLKIDSSHRHTLLCRISSQSRVSL